MQALFDSTDAFFAWLWRASWQASVLIVLVLLAQSLLRRQLTPRWRHALWVLVVIRLALPWSLESRVSLFNWFNGQSRFSSVTSPGDKPETLPGKPEPEKVMLNPQGPRPSSVSPEVATTVSGSIPPPAPAPRLWWLKWFPWLWVAGVVGLPSFLLMTTYRLGRRVRRQRPLTDAAVLNLVEDCKQEMVVRTPLTLVETSAVSSPSLYGFIRPRLLLPAGMTQRFSPAELRHVFLHELGHVKRGDIPMNWLTTALLTLHWFNPLVWYAFSRMRVDRELACDALALSYAEEMENQSYGQTIIKLLEGFSRPAIAPGLVGILENKTQLKERINMIAKFKKTNRWPALAIVLFTGLGLVALTDAQTGQGAKDRAEKSSTQGVGSAQAPPRIVATSPAVGATEVDPALTEITVTFDQDMAAGFSWTGSGPDYPMSPEGAKARWRDRRTCVLPVKLEAGRYYRVGINSTSYRNFKNVRDVAAEPSAIYFATRGASEELKLKTRSPQIVSFNPRNGAQDVSPSVTELRISFSVPMGEGFSWTGGGPKFPKIPDGKKPFWTDDRKTCVLPVALKPGWEYQLGLNSPSHRNFQSAAGVPLDPVVFTFKTSEK